jgi:DNA (cytosine-5)-methyltransferase 1
MLNGLDVFSGIGGLTIALREWVKPIAYCEIDPYCKGVLLSRMADKSLPDAPIWDDIKTLYGVPFAGAVDILYGGFPCQDISVAGNGKGLAGERSGLFFEIMRLAKEIKPKFIFLENVPAITTRGGLDVVREITSLGYDSRWCIISAASVGASHKRERWFFLANSASSCTNRYTKRKEEAHTLFTHSSVDSNSNCQSSKQTYSQTESEQGKNGTWRRSTGQYWPFESRDHWQEIVSSMGKCSDGLPYQVDRLRALGNAVVPAQAEKAFKILMGLN